MVGINQPRVSQLLGAGVLKRNGRAGEWLLSYCEHLREQAAGRASSGGLDLSQERAALAREQRVTYEIKNAISRGEYAPIVALADVLASASQSVIDQFNTLPGYLKQTRPNLSADDRAAIQTVLSKACREWARSTADLVKNRIALLHAEEAAPA